jgi:hypothetical protein
MTTASAPARTRPPLVWLGADVKDFLDIVFGEKNSPEKIRAAVPVDTMTELQRVAIARVFFENEELGLVAESLQTTAPRLRRVMTLGFSKLCENGGISVLCDLVRKARSLGY